MIGDWLIDDTPVEPVAAFAKKTFGKQDFSGFAGDPRFIQNAYSHRMFSKSRSSLAGLYTWRMQHSNSAREKESMARAADFAFRQAWALCPDSKEATFHYVAFLMEQQRVADAVLVADTTAQMSSMQRDEDQPLRSLVVTLKNMQKTKQASSGGK